MKTSLAIQNLKCGGCAHTISTKISALTGVEEVEVDVEKARVHFNYTNDDERALVINTLHQLGYPIVGAKNTVVSIAASFVSCAIGKISK